MPELSEENGSLELLGLTAREAEVLAYVSIGKTNKDVGEILKISPRTVQKHLQRIYAKLGVETRTAAAARALAGKARAGKRGKSSDK